MYDVGSKDHMSDDAERSGPVVPDRWIGWCLHDAVTVTERVSGPDTDAYAVAVAVAIAVTIAVC